MGKKYKGSHHSITICSVKFIIQMLMSKREKKYFNAEIIYITTGMTNNKRVGAEEMRMIKVELNKNMLTKTNVL